MLRAKMIVAVAASSLLLGACNATKQEQTTLIGAIAGGALGSGVGEGRGRLIATVAGAAIGGFIGGQIGKTMDENDRLRANRALETAPINETIEWQNPDSGNSYAVTPTKTYYASDNNARPCREYTTEAWIGGKKETIYGTACRQPDGSWQVQK